MKHNITKELFEAVMGESEYKKTLDCIIDDSILYHIPYSGNMEILINDFFFACKEWAYNQGYDMLSGGLEAGLHSCYIDYSDKRYTLSMKPINHFYSHSEQQAVFDACQWILDNKDKQ